MSSIKISTGLKVYDIEDENGNVRGQISFNPSDMNFYTRANDMVDNMDKWTLELEGLNDSELTEKDIADKVKELDARVKEEINQLFDDENASDVVFGNQNVFNTLNGVSFVERFLTAFMPIIQKEFEKEQKKSNERVSKYTKQVK